MQNTVFIFLSSLLILSCQSTSIEQNIENPEIDVNNTIGKEYDSMKQIMASRLEGFWMSKSYLDNVKKTKSPFKAKDYSASWFAFELQKKNLLSDDPKLFGMQSNEGGYYAELQWNSEDGYICANKNSFAWKTKEPFKIILVDSNLISIQSLMTTKNEEYVKVIDDDFALRQILFNGTYSINNSNTQVHFSPDGKIVGLTENPFFKIIYVFYIGIEYDMIMLQSEDGNWATEDDAFKFTFQGDSILLNPVILNFETNEHIIQDSTITLKKNGS